MVKIAIDAHIFYKHAVQEVADLNAAIIPMAEHIKAVGTGFDRSKMKQILGGEYFRLKEADRMRCILLRASRHARAHLGDYFPYMREAIMEQAEELETAVEHYWHELKQLIEEVMPTR